MKSSNVAQGQHKQQQLLVLLTAEQSLQDNDAVFTFCGRLIMVSRSVRSSGV
jgi:hypothetical protein